MKKFLSIVILISILVGTAFLVTGCNKKVKIIHILKRFHYIMDLLL